MENIKVSTCPDTQGFSPAGFEYLLTMSVRAEFSFLYRRWGLIYRFCTLADLTCSAHQHIEKKWVLNHFAFSLSSLHHACVLYNFMKKTGKFHVGNFSLIFLVSSHCLTPFNAEMLNLEPSKWTITMVSHPWSHATKTQLIWGYTLGWYWNHKWLWNFQQERAREKIVLESIHNYLKNRFKYEQEEELHYKHSNLPRRRSKDDLP